MGFLSDVADQDTGKEAPKPEYKGFLSDNPPPVEAAPQVKSPEWSEVPAQMLANAPESAWNFLKNTAQPFLHPIETAENLGKTGLGYMEKAGRHMGLPSGQGYEQYADALNQMVMDRYGSVDNFKKTLASDPVGVAGDLSMLLTGGGGAAARLPGVAGKVGEVAQTAGRLTDPFSAPIAAGKLAGKATAAGAGYLTGAGMRSMEEAAHAGYEGGEAARTFRENQLGQVPAEDFVRQAHDALDNMRKERGNAYTQGMIPVKQSQAVLNWNDVGRAIQDAHRVASFKGQELLDPRGAAMRNNLDNMIIEWMQLPAKDYHTAEGFDALKKKIGNVVDATEPKTPERTIAMKYYNAVKKTIVNQVPEYAKVMQGYDEASDLVRQIERTLSLPADERKLNVDTALRKLQSTLRKNVNTNYGQRERLLDFIEAAGAPHLRSAIAGQALSSPEAHGLARLGPAIAAMHPSAIKEAAVMGLASPKIVGTAAYRAGQAAKPFKYIPRQTPEVSQQIGRWMPNVEIRPVQEARGGAVDRALRIAKKR